ncbi:hypothetical protein SAMN05216223_10282 [Actinacidiphila yanglinensis]|uniref:Uncharacterized protein n=1 Tax=Actinacidiphila yanglinensis TaxID=310779 RepID=A0A1H5V1V7_9ACTN|nr:hypothetical protein [Actinacidiphila yanglinensis]SEF80417.1 hypothetical protein SAMN05216223_10282 [Actinacidiphila yanglinensis]
MLTGVLIAESLRVGGVFEGVPLEVTGMRRIEVPAPAGGQPGRWTLLDFRAPEDAAEPLAAALAGCLAPTGGWYVNYSTGAEAFVVFAGRVFRYPRGDAAARAEVEEYARGVGVPEAQLDWVD